MKKFGEGWSEEKLLAYSLQSSVTGILGYAELLQDSNLNDRDSKLVDHILKASKRGADEIERWYRIICDKERGLAPNTARSRPPSHLDFEDRGNHDGGSLKIPFCQGEVRLKRVYVRFEAV